MLNLREKLSGKKYNSLKLNFHYSNNRKVFIQNLRFHRYACNIDQKYNILQKYVLIM